MGLKINKDKTIIYMKVKTRNLQMVTVTNGSVDQVGEFTYLGTVGNVTILQEA